MRWPPARTSRRREAVRSLLGLAAGLHHFFNRPDAGDRLFGKSERHGHGARQPAVDIHRASAHSLQDAGFGQRPAREARQDERLLGADVLEDTEDFDLKFLDSRAGKDGLADAFQSGPDVFQREELGLSR